MSLSQTQQDSLQESLNRGQFFEQIIHSDGWKYLKSYYEARIQAFATELLTREDDILKHEKERQRIIGIKQLFSQVNSDIKTVQNERQKPKTTTTE